METSPNRPYRKIVLILVAVVVALFAGRYAIRWWTVGRFIETTNDAYLRADSVTVAPKISGYIGVVLVGDNQKVVVDQVLARIDAQDYRAALARQQATRDARKADIAVARAQIAQSQAAVMRARMELAGAVVADKFAQSQETRYRKLTATGAETAEHLAQMVNQREQADVTVKTDQAALDSAVKNADTVAAQLGQAIAQAEAAQASVHASTLDLDNTAIKAPIAGRVGDRTVRRGQYVQPGTRLLTIVPVTQIYAVANFKETQLVDMAIGQPAKIEIDALGGKTIDGVVDSFSPGTGSEFALLPPENATGNFTKIVQRVPVKIRLTIPAALADRLVPGLSVTVSVDTKVDPRPEPGAAAPGNAR